VNICINYTINKDICIDQVRRKSYLLKVNFVHYHGLILLMNSFNDICRPCYCCHEYVSCLDTTYGTSWRVPHTEQEIIALPDFTSGFHRGLCCPVIRVSLFHVIGLSFGFWIVIVPFVWLLSISRFFTLTLKQIVSFFLRHSLICNVSYR